MAKQKFYVVWIGRKRGVFRSWDECSSQVNGYIGAKYKAFNSLQEAEIALNGNYSAYFKKNISTTDKNNPWTNSVSKPVIPSICVDAACSGVPGPVEWQGVNLEDGKELFKAGPFQQGTNNIGEFLAIIQGLKWLINNHSSLVLYSDSATAISWVKQKQCKTQQEKNIYNRGLFDLILDGEKWLVENKSPNEVLKWVTEEWGEIPADFGRK